MVCSQCELLFQSLLTNTFNDKDVNEEINLGVTFQRVLRGVPTVRPKLSMRYVSMD